MTANKTPENLEDAELDETQGAGMPDLQIKPAVTGPGGIGLRADGERFIKRTGIRQPGIRQPGIRATKK